jgi:hypothetical protein
MRSLMLMKVFPLAFVSCVWPSIAQESRLAVWRGRAAEPFTSDEYRVAAFDRAVLSWNAAGEAVFELGVGDAWHRVGKSGERPEGVKSGSVDVDTLVLKEPAVSFRFRVTPAAGAVVTRVSVAHWRDGERRPFAAVRSPAWGRVLDVPQRSQVVEEKDPGRICSPTSLSMVLEFHGVKKPTREVCEGVYDHAAKIYGNWALNAAYAHRASGLEAWVARFMGLEDLEDEIAAGRPVVLSHRWKKGDLDGAPVAETDGHLIVVVGFTDEGDVVVNDPAARPGGVRRTYQRRQIYTTWLERASGVVYVLKRGD